MTTHHVRRIVEDTIAQLIGLLLAVAVVVALNAWVWE